MAGESQKSGRIYLSRHVYLALPIYGIYWWSFIVDVKIGMCPVEAEYVGFDSRWLSDLFLGLGCNVS